MSELENPVPRIRHYFVDEAGDPSLLKKHGKSIVGQDGCSKYFILGMADVEEPDIVATELESLRKGLLSDPYYQSALQGTAPQTRRLPDPFCTMRQSDRTEALETALEASRRNLRAKWGIPRACGHSMARQHGERRSKALPADDRGALRQSGAKSGAAGVRKPSQCTGSNKKALKNTENQCF